MPVIVKELFRKIFNLPDPFMDRPGKHMFRAV